jgi:hypothetical protein
MTSSGYDPLRYTRPDHPDAEARGIARDLLSAALAAAQSGIMKEVAALQETFDNIRHTLPVSDAVRFDWNGISGKVDDILVDAVYSLQEYLEDFPTCD